MLATMSNTNSSVIDHPLFWRFLGFGSSIVGFICYALSPTFKYMFGEWNWWKIVIYSVVSSVFACFMLYVKGLDLKKSFIVKANVCFLVFLATCAYSFYQDKGEGGKNESDYGRMLSLFSFGGFALMSLSLSRQTNIGFDMGMSNFFLASFFVCAMKLNLKVAMGVALICYLVVYIRSYSDSMLEMQGSDTAHLILEMDGLSQNQTGSIVENFHSNLDYLLERQGGKADEISAVIRVKFDKAKEEVNSDLAIFAADLVGILEKHADTHPEWQEAIEDLLILARSCALTSPGEFWPQCEGIVQELDDKRRDLPPGMLKQLHTRMLFILTRCTRFRFLQREFRLGFSSNLAGDLHQPHQLGSAHMS
ncbi:hypothetical protein L6164_001482 [Bauhinia variegata]|uniref:Uncharacterized protein n=1 Tax=Bauhinia variegata TaxID=167791 RepID=A0ACB9QBX8_BAUVA|nr:hypothetical protein L6164_001482 [Bauhinia variegata]